MSSVLFVTQRPGAADILALLSHTVTQSPDSEDALRHVDAADVVVVDGCDDLARARAVTSTLRGARPEAPILLVVPAGALALVGRDWGFTDFIVSGAEPTELDARIKLLLRYLMQHQGRVLTREVMLSQVWGYDYFGGTRTVDVHIRRLRAKLGQFDYFIGTVRNVGYRFTSFREGRHGDD